MAYTRLSQDELAYQSKVFESVRPGMYSLQPESTYNPNACRPTEPETRIGSSMYNITQNNDMVNMESDLRNLNRKTSKDPKAQYPFIQKSYTDMSSVVPECPLSQTLAPRQTQLEAPTIKREQTVDIPRFESMCLDPQEFSRIRSNNYIGVETRLYNRDNYKMKKPMPLSVLPVLPLEKAPVKTSYVDYFTQSAIIGLPGQIPFQSVPRSSSSSNGGVEGFCNCSR